MLEPGTKLCLFDIDLIQTLLELFCKEKTFFVADFRCWT